MQQKPTSERQTSTKPGLLIKNYDLKIGSLGSLKAKRNQSFRGIATLFATRAWIEYRTQRKVFEIWPVIRIYVTINSR